MKATANARRDRLAAALRENLKRRKARARREPDDKARPRPSPAKKGA